MARHHSVKIKQCITMEHKKYILLLLLGIENNYNDTKLSLSLKPYLINRTSIVGLSVGIKHFLKLWQKCG